MKKLVLILAIVFAFGVTFAVNAPVQEQKAKTEQVSSKDEKEKKKCCEKAEKKCCEKAEKKCCDKAEKKCCEKKADCPKK